ncbi:MAG: MBL fold metallo-hydrolase [Anaerolineales bacterium]
MQSKNIKLIVLGSANALPDQQHDNTHFLLVTDRERILIDCPNNPYVRLQQAGIDPLQLTGLILTHFHPDHISGLPTLLMNLWLRKRKNSLAVSGLDSTLQLFEKLMALFEWEKWEERFPVETHPLADRAMQCVFRDQSVEILSSPVCHLIPTIGLRINNLQTGQSVAYSCDSEPCTNVIELARGVKVLFHEAAGEAKGHSGPRQAGWVAQQAAVKQLYLIHYPVYEVQPQQWIAQASQEFQGDIKLAEDGMAIEF